METTLVSPLDGTVVPLSQVPDPVFSEHMLGNGLALLPTTQTVFAPFDGTITNINPASHALLITHNNIELLIHVGLESVALKGEGFKLFVQKGQSVTAGQKLLSFDLDLLKQKAASPLVILVITSPADAPITVMADTTVKTGLPLFSLDTSTEKTSNLSSTEVLESTPIIIRSPNGLHARPTAILANLAAGYPYRVEICKHRQCADAKSIVGIMGLGLVYGDPVIIRVFGPKEQAKPILAQLKNKLEQVPPNTQPLPAEKTAASKDVSLHIKGLSACGGLVCAPAFLLAPNTLSFEENSTNPQEENKAFEEALLVLSEQMETRLAKEKNEIARDILNTHLQLLKDPLLENSTRQTIRQGKTAAFAFNNAIRRSIDTLKQTNNRFLMERIADLKDLRREVLSQLTGQQRKAVAVPPGSIVVAEELLPSDVSALPEHTAGVLLAGSSPTAHVGILLRNRNIPSVVRAGQEILDILPQTTLLLDADAGNVIISPSPAQQKEFLERIHRLAEVNKEENSRAQEPAVTQDGLRIYVEGNISHLEEASRVYKAGAEGIGLVRTEFLFQDQPLPPSEEEQKEAYQSILDNMPGQPVTFRMLDAGGDKPMPFVNIVPEDNPLVGIRGIRALKNNEHFFRTQLRALLRLTPQSRIRIMLPMVSFIQEVTRFRQIIQEEMTNLGLTQPTQLGVMIEVPSAALLAKSLAQHADFFSIGTNDLTQYTLAIDRGHKELSTLSDPLHPSVLQLIALTCQGAQAYDKPVSVCGAMAGDPAAIPLLIGIGITHLAVSIGALARTKALIRRLDARQCRQAAQQALQMAETQEVRDLVQKQFAIS